MKNILLIGALLIVAVPLAAQTGGRAAATGKTVTEGNTEQQLMRLERQMADAVIKRDVQALAQMLADDGPFTSPDGKVHTKAEVLADIKSGEFQLESTDLSDMRVRIYGDTAIVMYASNDKMKYQGQDVSGKNQNTDIFFRHAGKWQAVGGHATTIPAPANKK